jgi:hypothetical protein
MENTPLDQSVNETMILKVSWRNYCENFKHVHLTKKYDSIARDIYEFPMQTCEIRRICVRFLTTLHHIPHTDQQKVSSKDNILWSRD